MIYVRITLLLKDGSKRSGVRAFTGVATIQDIKSYSWELATAALGPGVVEGVNVEDLPSTHAEVIALIAKSNAKLPEVPRSDGTHPYVKQQQLKQRH